MRYTDNMANYQPLVIPISKHFCELSKKEAKDYFNWFLSHLDERSDYLRQKVSLGINISEDSLDFSLDSLKPIWKWFLQVAEVVPTDKAILKKIEKSLAGQPKSFIDHMLQQRSKELSVFTEYVLRDIGMYIGKLFISNYDCLKWTIKHTPKSYVHVNVPLIVGFIDDDESYPKPFHPDLDPIHLARVPAIGLFSNTQKEEDLYNWCVKWANYVPQE